jgi:hypothetical protein
MLTLTTKHTENMMKFKIKNFSSIMFAKDIEDLMLKLSTEFKNLDVAVHCILGTGMKKVSFISIDANGCAVNSYAERTPFDFEQLKSDAQNNYSVEET